MFALKHLFQDTSPKLTLDLFHKFISPILLYGAEVWGICGRKLTIKSFENFPAEKLYLAFSKFVLGVNRRTSNAAVRGELGTYPMYIRVLQTMFKFHERLSNRPAESLLGKAYTMCVNLHKNNRSGWFTSIVKTLDYCNMRLGHTDHKTLEMSLRARYRAHWRIVIEEGSKTQLYKDLENDISFCRYLTDIKNKNCRRAFTKVRVSAHTLAVETGRYTKPKTERHMRICRYCNLGQIEDETHFLVTCPLYQERCNLRTQISAICPNFSTLGPDAQTLYLLSAEGQICNLVAKYCYDAFETRTKCGQTNTN